MEFESKLNNTANVNKLRDRVEQYLKTAYGGDSDKDGSEASE